MFTEWRRRGKWAGVRCGRRSLQLERLESRCCLAGIVMSNHEQLLVELINRARSDPAAEAARYGIDLNQGLPPGTITPAPKQPLAPHQALVNAAGAHSQDMLNRDYFAHVSPEGITPFDRMLAAGYTGAIGTLENISWGGTTGTLDQNAAVFQRHESLFRSSGHRSAMLRMSAREVGTGVRFGVFTEQGVNYNASMVTEDFGARPGDPFITGVVFADSIVRDQFYSLGEGVGSATITAVHATAGTSYSTPSGPSGGYALQVPAGVYTVTAEGPALGGAIIVTSVVVQAENRKVDFETTNRPEIVVELNGSDIADGTLTAIDFGNVQQGQPGSTRTFTLRNIGAQNLTLGAITVPVGFTLVESLVSNLPPGGFDTFTIQLDGSASGTKAGDVSFVTNDGDESPFNFAIVGVVTPPPTPPTISDIANLSTNEDTATAAISFAVGSAQFAATQLTLIAHTSNAVLVPAANVVLGGSGADRTLTITPAANQFGSVTIQVVVADPGGLNASDLFVLTVLPVNDPPTIAPIGDQFIVKNGSRSVTLVIQDIDTPAAQLTVAATTSHEVFLAPGGLSITGTGTTRTLSLVPASEQEGMAAIAIRVDDAELQTSTSFTAWVSENPFPWHNATKPMDVDNGGQTAPLDALLIINYLNAGFSTKILPTAGIGAGPGFLDTSGDNEIAPLDALLVINALNAGLGGEGEATRHEQRTGSGEFEIRNQGLEAIDDAGLIELLAVDATEYSLKRRRVG